MSRTREGRRARTVLAITFAMVLIAPARDAAAQVLAVEAGEHADFTRLVVRIGEGREWDLDQIDGTWRLTLSPGIDAFDLSSSFDLIQRTRVADLSQDEDALEIALACACRVSAFRYRDTFVVIDVSDPVPEEDAGTAPASETAPVVDDQTADRAVPATDANVETASEAQVERSEPSGPASPRRATAAEIAAAALPDLSRLLTPGLALDAESEDVLTTPTPTPPRADDLQPSATESARPDIEEAAQIMAEQLARAAAAGLLEPSAGTPLTFADPAPAAERRADPPTPLTIAPAQPLTAGAVDGGPGRLPPSDPPILARNAFDIAAAPRPDAAPVQPRLACVGRVHPLASSAGGTEETPNVYALGVLRQAVYDDRDQLVEDAVLRLALHYLRLGFGAEAAFWLTRLDNPSGELLALARMADGLETTLYADVTDPSACSDQELLFRYLGGAMKSPIAETEARRIQQGFAALPDQLQRQFGPEIARRLYAEGQAGPAVNIRDMLRRSGVVPEAELLALEFDLGTVPHEPELEAALTEALRDDGAMPAATMARSLALDRQQGRRPDPERVIAAEALLRETPNGRDGDLLWREITIGHARLGQIDAALDVLMDGDSRDPNIWQSAITGLVADRLSVEDSATLLILAHLVGDDWTAQGSETGRIRVAASQFLRDQGLEEAATQIMSGRPALVVPDLDDADAPTAPSGWAQSPWADAAETFSGAHGDIARRMAAQEEDPGRAADGVDDVIDLDALSERIADTRALRDAANAILTLAPQPASTGAGAE